MYILVSAYPYEQNIPVRSFVVLNKEAGVCLRVEVLLKKNVLAI